MGQPRHEVNVVELEELVAAASVAHDEVMPFIHRVLAREGVSIMGRSKNEDLSDILGDTDTPATTKAKGAVAMPKEKTSTKATPASKKAVIAKPTPKTNGAAAPAAKRATRSDAGGGKYYFPADSKEFQALKAKIATIKKPVSTKDLASALKTDTWKVRLVSVVLESEKRIKREKAGNVLVLKPR